MRMKGKVSFLITPFLCVWLSLGYFSFWFFNCRSHQINLVLWFCSNPIIESAKKFGFWFWTGFLHLGLCFLMKRWDLYSWMLKREEDWWRREKIWVLVVMDEIEDFLLMAALVTIIDVQWVCPAEINLFWFGSKRQSLAFGWNFRWNLSPFSVPSDFCWKWIMISPKGLLISKEMN